jgi:hypothetical protein
LALQGLAFARKREAGVRSAENEWRNLPPAKVSLSRKSYAFRSRAGQGRVPSSPANLPSGVIRAVAPRQQRTPISADLL